MKDDFKEVVLSARQDDFFRRNQHSNFGDLGTAIKVCLRRYSWLWQSCACACMCRARQVEPCIPARAVRLYISEGLCVGLPLT